MIKNSYVYFITNKHKNVLYTGVTSDLEKRLYEHKHKLIDGFSKQYNVDRLVYIENFSCIEDALKRERQIKKWRREKKDALVNKQNPEWKDLSLGWYEGDPSIALRSSRDDDKKENVIPSEVEESPDQRKASPIWHPFTQHKIFPDAINVKSAKGVYLHTQDGRKIIDGISSWWINVHGHCHPKIIEAVQKASVEVDQVIFAGFTHNAAEELAEKLIANTGENLTRVFFSDSGSTAVEVALKMAVGYWHNIDQPRKTIVALEHGYHGDTFGTMAAGARSVYNAAYDPFLFDVVHLPFPKGDGLNTIVAFEKLLKERGSDIAAFICEPLVLGAGGMMMYDADVLKKLHALCQKYDVFFIADEVMTGWGRTGTKWACDQAGFTPDILCTSKGLTGGYLPLAVTMASERIYEGFYSDDRAKTFFHSSSFTGNAISCAAANAAIDLWDIEPVQERIDNVGKWHKEFSPVLETRGDIQNLRQTGTIAAMDIKTDGAGYLSDIGPKLYNFYIENGVLLRPLGNTVYILPPYCITKEELERIYDTISRSLDYIRHEREQRAA